MMAGEIDGGDTNGAGPINSSAGLW
jgi:hypothetical protein